MAISKFDKERLRLIEKIQSQVKSIYKEAVSDAVGMGTAIEKVDFDKVFSFDDYPQMRKRLGKLLTGLSSDLENTIVRGVDKAWALSNLSNDELCKSVLGGRIGTLSSERYNYYFSTNDAAREAFHARRTAGLNLSDRVWKYTEQFKDEIELGIDIGLRDGLSAAEMVRDLKRYLQRPDELFRRVRDEHGILHLSKRAKEYHPGAGVYRSSYKNAMRLARTEPNIAYHEADHKRWETMDFVVGIEIVLSGNHTCLGADGKPHEFTDICDELAGRYPKDFKFTGWHPQCRCSVKTILKTDEEMEEDDERILQGLEPKEESENTVSKLPSQYNEWLEKNKVRIDSKHPTKYIFQTS